ncbi:MAG: ATP-binding protein [Muribaculaceae bacterium]|nr:ATP-binding protein [Muribaculaceae bacterium]
MAMTETYILVILLVLAVAGYIVLWHTSLRHKRTVTRGLELIASQDFNNRLTHTGIHGPDKIVDLFNTMIDTLRSERTKNLEQENFLQLLTQASPMGVLMLDFDRKINMVNPAFLKITGTEESEIIGKRIETLLTTDNRQPTTLIREMVKVRLGGNEVIRDGDLMTYRCYHLSFVQTGFRREFYLLESLTEEVMKAEREAYEKVIRTISHEVNNTMGGVRSVIQTISDTSYDADTIEVLESCDNRCEQMCAFVSAYADVVRLPEPMRQPTDLNEEIAHQIPFLRMMTKENVKLEFIPASEPVMAHIDTNMMQQVMVNIVKNANESIPAEGGKIKITAINDGGHPMIEIANDGEPISEEVSRNLFRPFYTTKRSGRGIGLTLTAEILNRHGARFSLRTDSDSITRFRIVF